MTSDASLPADDESRWPASLAVLAALVLYLTLPGKFTLGPNWVIPVLEGALLAALTVTRPRRRGELSARRRVLSVLLIGVVSLANIASVVLLARFLLHGGQASGRSLILAAIQIWLTNVAAFALWFWELDGGGPVGRARALSPSPDFLFPQMTLPEISPPGWRAGFVDYLYLSFTNSTALSPTDTMPLTARAKALMAVQAAASLLTVVLVASRAVNILR